MVDRLVRPGIAPAGPGADTLGTVTTVILPLPARLSRCPEAMFLPVAGVAPLLRILDGLRPRTELVIAAAPSLMPSIREAMRDVAVVEGVSVVLVTAEPPGRRAQCVAAALAAIEGDAPVLLHDIEWPAVSPALVDRLVGALTGGAIAAFPVLPVTDSVKAVDAHGTVLATLDRALLRSVQYPRGYAAATLAALAAGDHVGAFDDLALALAADLPVTLVDGDADAISAELPRDAEFLSAVLESREHPSGP